MNSPWNSNCLPIWNSAKSVLLDTPQRIEPALLLEDVLVRGQIDRGGVARVIRMSDRSGRRVLESLVEEGLLASDTPKGPISLRFPIKAVDSLFPRLFPEA